MIYALVLVIALNGAYAQQKLDQRPCSGPEYSKLDFWIGQWDVVSPKGAPEGTNRIEKILSGCAIVENWRDTEGHEGKSLFYYQPVGKQWRQVWVTDAGPIKEKQLLSDYDGPGVRFQGELPRRSGQGTYLDRTTLLPETNGDVRQIIEISLDGGKTWDSKLRWEGIYRRNATDRRP